MDDMLYHIYYVVGTTADAKRMFQNAFETLYQKFLVIDKYDDGCGLKLVKEDTCYHFITLDQLLKRPQKMVADNWTIDYTCNGFDKDDLVKAVEILCEAYRTNDDE